MAFRLNVLLLEMTTDGCSVGYIVCAWLRTHQPAAAPGHAFALDIDMIDNGTDALPDRPDPVGSGARDDQGSLGHLPARTRAPVLDEQPAAMPALALLKSVAMTGEGRWPRSIRLPDASGR
jgi:hypothetical protein